MTQPRRIVPGDFCMLTRRTTQRMFLLRPDNITRAILSYCLAVAAQRHGISLIAWLVMSNHYHAVVYDPEGKVPAFIEHFHKLVAKCLNAHYKRWENVWSTEETCVTRLVTLEDVFDKVAYVLTNPAAADLVESVADWPGVSSWTAMGTDGEIVPRPEVYFRKNGRMPTTATLVAAAPYGLTESYAQWIARVRREVERRERKLSATRRKNRTRVAGRKAVCATSPFAMPETIAVHGKLRPTLACKNKERMRTERRALTEFRTAYRGALDRLRQGKRNVEFPLGTYRLRLLGMRCCPFPDEPVKQAA